MNLPLYRPEEAVQVRKWASASSQVTHGPQDVPGPMQDAMRSSFALCHDRRRGGITGSECLMCPYFGGVADLSPACEDCGRVHPDNQTCTQWLAAIHGGRVEDGGPHPLKRYRGICFFPMARRVDAAAGAHVVRCPIAKAKVPEAENWQERISIAHCRDCEFCRGIGGARRRRGLGHLLLRVFGVSPKRPTPPVVVRCAASKRVQYEPVHIERSE